MDHFNFFAVCVIIYSCLIYPLLLILFARKLGQQNKHAADQEYSFPPVSHIVAVFNGEETIGEKIEDALLSAPKLGFHELIIVTDGCTDDSAVIVAADPRVKLIELPKRVGKEAAVIEGIKEATGEVIIFSDLGTRMLHGSVSSLLNNFWQTNVGVVSSVDSIAADKYSIVALFIRFEMMLRRYESRLSSCVGVSGSYFAARKHLCERLTGRGCSDLEIAMIAVRCGQRVITDEKVIGYYSASETFIDEFERKQRTIVHGIATVAASGDLLNISRHGWFSWQLFSHKILSWFTAICGVWLIIYFVTEAVLSVPYITVSVMLALGVFVLTSERTNLNNIGFLLASISAILGAIFALCRGNRYRTWKPSNK